MGRGIGNSPQSRIPYDDIHNGGRRNATHMPNTIRTRDRALYMDSTGQYGEYRKYRIPGIKGLLEFKPKGCIMYTMDIEPEGNTDFCNATPIGEYWPQCIRDKGHEGRHESIDQWWDDQNPIAMKRY